MTGPTCSCTHSYTHARVRPSAHNSGWQAAVAKAVIAKVSFDANGDAVFPDGSKLRLLDADVQLLVSPEAGIETVLGMAGVKLAEMVDDVPDWVGQLGEGLRKVFILYHGTTIIGIVVVDKTDVGSMAEVQGTEQGLIKALHHVRAYMVDEAAAGKYCGLALARKAIHYVAEVEQADYVTHDIKRGNESSYGCLNTAAQAYGFTVEQLGVMEAPSNPPPAGAPGAREGQRPGALRGGAQRGRLLGAV